MPSSRKLFLAFVSLVYLAILMLAKPQAWVKDAIAAPISDIRATRHNFSTTTTTRSGASVPSRTIYSSSESQVCVFCHTPHGATADTPLWNRATSNATYTLYSSTSLDAVLNSPGGSSKLCLSCHDGTLAPANVNNSPGSGTTGSISAGSGKLGKFDDDLSTTAATGFTRHLGGTIAQKDLSNDHPISVTYDETLRTNDGELRAPVSYDGVLTPGLRVSGKKPLAPLEKTNGATIDGQVQCASCHDPHVIEQDTANFGTANKFLRINRFQGTTNPSSTDGSFDPTNDISCLACHQKKGWGSSAHAIDTVGDERYDAGKAINGDSGRQFNISGSTTSNLPVWRAACLNCHDTHTVQGATRLLREGVTDINASGQRTGSGRRLENTCYQCHSPNSNAYNVLPTGTSGSSGLRQPSAITGGATVPDIESAFTGIRMPLVQTNETHDIVNADFQECKKNLGGTLTEESSIISKCGTASGTRHVECTDCHNPHRVRRAARFYNASANTANDPGNYRTHIPAGDDPAITGTDGLLGNVASGALRGIWGVEPTYPSITADTVWPNEPSFTVKKGDPGTSTSFAKTDSYLTREYQLCFKCHSNYAYDSTPPALGGTDLTAASANGYNTNNAAAKYTNQAAEFAVAAKELDATGKVSSLTGTHQCEDGNDATGDTCTPIGAGTWDNTGNKAKNHRSWHPVMFPTGRTATERGGSNANFRAPFQAGLGKQTMHCSDCHGPSSSWTEGTGPDYSKVQGPHGSANNFLLRGTWNSSTDEPDALAVGQLCRQCHVGNVSRSQSGWGNADTTGHNSSEHGRNCGRCHIAVPHGWKNKAFLVNVNCVGKEAGEASDCVSKTTPFSRGPYYVGARLRVKTWQSSGQWSEASCGPYSGTAGKDWMTSNCG